jgi:anti-sigma factor RsiW
MHAEMRLLLNAYLDGELQGVRLLELEHHLASCESCREELKELRLLSGLLRAAPAPDFLPAQRFASNLALSLPRRSLPDLPQKPVSLAWWLVPAGLMAAWFFLQTVFTLTNLFTAADTTGLFGHAVSLVGGGQQTLWFAALTGLFTGQAGGLTDTLSLLNGLDLFGVEILQGFLWQALIVILYWVWLAVWWLRRRPQLMRLNDVAQ